MERRLISPVAIPLAAYISGILLQYCGLPMWASLSMIVCGTLLAIGIMIGERDLTRAFRLQPLYIIPVVLIVAGVASVASAMTAPMRVADDDFSHYAGASGRITSVRSNDYGDRAEVSVSHLYEKDGNTYPCRNMDILLTTRDLKASPGDLITFPANIERIKGDPNRFENDYVDRYERSGIYYRAKVESEAVIKYGHREDLRTLAGRVLDSLESRIEHANLQRDTRYFLITVLLGDRDYLSQSERDLFASCGVAHILALSGMHVAIIGGILVVLLFPLSIIGRYRWRIVITAVLLLFYAFITGFAYSIVRSCLMLIFVAVGICLERKQSGINSLMAAILLILIFTPRAIFDVGFQLSVSCVASILLFANDLNPVEQHEHPRLYRIAAALLVSLTTTLSTWCISAYYFGMIPLMFLPANLLILPLLPYFIVLALCAMTMDGIPIVGNWMCRATDTAYDLMHGYMEWLSDGGASSYTLSVNGLSVWLWIGAIAVFAMALRMRRRRLAAGISTVMALGSIAMVVMSPDRADAAVIVQNYSDRISLVSKDGSLPEQETEIDAGCISVVETAAGRVVVIDDEYDAEPGQFPSADYIVIGRGHKGSVAEIVERFHPRILLIHPYMERDREERLCVEADSLSISIHRLRESPYLIKGVRR